MFKGLCHEVKKIMELHGDSFWIGILVMVMIISIFGSGFLLGTKINDIPQLRDRIIINNTYEKLIDSTVTIKTTHDDDIITVTPSRG